MALLQEAKQEAHETGAETLLIVSTSKVMSNEMSLPSRER